MSVERINSQLKKVREQIAQLQAKEKDLAEQKQMAEDAEAMKIIRKYKSFIIVKSGGFLWLKR